uniref:NADH dehydrogenase subunit 5 n=1 Tax=Synergus nanlingensis TaxID=3135082 RepID=UPI0030FE5175
MIYNLYMWLLLIYSFNLFIFSMVFFIMKKIIFIEWFIYSINSCNFEFILNFDWMMLMFMSVVMFISSMVMLYSKEYMLMDYKNKYLIMILMMFIISMMLMIISPNIMSIILRWDGLFNFYCLIIYYKNMNSYNSGMLTLLMNRIGDVMLLMMIFLLMNLGSWNLMYFNFKNYLFIIFFLIMIMTKSAQIPFSMWLPAAMAAPTPVSSLVHSSTLVTAGVYLMIRFYKLFNFNSMNLIIMIIGIFTMMISSINAMFEFDLKKIIAFSTLSQLGLMILMLSMNLNKFVFFHLISHAMFKSLLFLCSGVIIHFMNGIQDIRYMGMLINEVPLIMMFFNISTLSLCGFPFLSSFYSKDLLYEMMLNYNLNMLIYYILYLCIMFTMIYSFRLMILFNYKFYYMFIKGKMNLSNKFFHNFFIYMKNYFWEKMSKMFPSWMLPVINFNIKKKLFIMMFFSLIIFFVMNFVDFKFKIKFIKLVDMLSLFLFLLKLNLLNNKNLFFVSKIFNKLNENLWNEYFGKMMFMYMFNNLNKLYINMYLNMYMMMCLMFIYMLMFYYIVY